MINFKEFKRYFLYSLLGSLVISAILAVITVLTGTFSEVTGRILFTLAMVVLHSLISLVFIWDNDRQRTFERLSFFINVLFTIIVVSFITSIFGIWEILDSEFVWKLYQSYMVVVFAALHGDILSKALNKEKYLDRIVYVNYVFMAIVVMMLLVILFTNDAEKALGEMFFRILGAALIIDGTLSVMAIIFYKIYMNKHPEVSNALAGGNPLEEKQKKGLSIWVWILIIYLLAQIILPLLFLGFSVLTD